MKIGLAQIQPIKGDIAENIALHKAVIQLALSNHLDALFFPELSLTGYEPELANRLQLDLFDKRLDLFQPLSNQGNITIGIGMPITQPRGIEIGMLLFQPNKARQKYAKQLLHEDEKPYFVAGKEQVLIYQKETIIAPAICYESLQASHFHTAIEKGATIYVASVAKAQKGIDKACTYFSSLSNIHSIPILMVNSVGHCDNFESAGQTTVWNSKGRLLRQLSETETGLLIYDTLRQECMTLNIGL